MDLLNSPFVQIEVAPMIYWWQPPLQLLLAHICNLAQNRRDTCDELAAGQTDLTATETAKYVSVPLESSEVGQKSSHGMDSKGE
jgi:hypothetical protein